MNIEDEVLNNAAQQIADEIDFEIISGMLQEMGWIKVTRSPFVSNKEAVDIGYWIDEQTTGQVKSRGRTWLFEQPKDATMFILRWGESDSSRH